MAEAVKGKTTKRKLGNGSTAFRVPVSDRPQPMTCAENTNRRSKFRIGQIVQLVTGSFPMAVAAIERRGMIKCVSCYPGGNHIEHHHLPEAALTTARAPKLPRKAEAANGKDDIPF